MVLVAALLAHLVTPSSKAAAPTRTSRYLTSNPDDEIAKYQQEKRSQLETGSWVDEQHFARIPIEQAMRALAAENAK